MSHSLKPTDSNSPPSNINQVHDETLTISTYNSLMELKNQKSIYWNYFTELLSQAKSSANELHIEDVLRLESEGSDLEAQCIRTKEAIQALAKSDKVSANNFKIEYDQNLAELHQLMTSSLQSIIPSILKDLKKTFQEISDSSAVDPSQYLHLQMAIQQMNLLIQKVDNQVRKIQTQRLFELH